MRRKIVYAHDRDRFLLCLFVPENRREAFLAAYALNAELAQVREKISEELIGQVRLAWWQERIGDSYAGKPAAGHPVLEALQLVTPHVPKELLVGLVEEYRKNFADILSPPEGEVVEIDNVMEAISLHLLRALCPDAEPHWRRAQGIIAKHRKRYGQRRNGWLSFRLLIGA